MVIKAKQKLKNYTEFHSITGIKFIDIHSLVSTECSSDEIKFWDLRMIDSFTLTK